MTTLTMKTEVTFAVIDCCSCGVQFAVPEDLDRYWRSHRREVTFYCPNGHSQSYMGKSDRELLRDAKAEAARESERAAAAERKLRGEREAYRKRAAAGICPCCHRSFVQLARHVKSKHPNYAQGG